MNEMDEENQKYRKISYEDLLESMDSGSAFRQITRLYTAGGKGSKVYPPTFAGIEFSPYRARRFFARHLWDSGVRAELIQKAMGHEKIDTTPDLHST